MAEPESPELIPAPDPLGAEIARPDRARWLALAILVVVTLAAYANSFGGPLIFDDVVSIENNASLRSSNRWLSPPQATAGVGGRRRRQIVDQQAAVVLLQSWLDANRSGGPSQ